MSSMPHCTDVQDPMSHMKLFHDKNRLCVYDCEDKNRFTPLYFPMDFIVQFIINFLPRFLYLVETLCKKTKLKKKQKRTKKNNWKKKKTRGNFVNLFFVSADCPLSPSFSPLYVRVVQ